MMQSKNLIDAMTTEKMTTAASGNTTKDRAQKNEKQKCWCKNCKQWIYQNNNKCSVLETNKDKCPQWYIDKMENKSKHKGPTKNDGERGLGKVVSTWNKIATT